MSKRHRHNTLTADEASRALYVDFEGRKEGPPILLGVARKAGVGETPRAHQTITDPLFVPLAVERELEYEPLVDAIEGILTRAEKRHRLIVAWSIHEWEVVRDYAPQKLDRFEARFVNAKLVAERWRSRCHPESKPATSDLATYMGLVGRDVPDGAGPGRTSETIDALRTTLGAGRQPTPNQRRRWADLLLHNAHDCAGMKEVCLRATRDLEGEERLA